VKSNTGRIAIAKSSEERYGDPVDVAIQS